MSAQQTLDRFRPNVAWRPYFPTGSKPWDAVRIGHLYRRTTFGLQDGDLEFADERTPQEVVQRILKGRAGQDDFEENYERLRAGALASGNVEQVQTLWMYRLLYSPHPLQEKMTLFWHDHFATSNAKVDDVRLMQRQNDLFRENALGHFGEMLTGITRDPAMLVWLDADTNKQGKPNENLAREILELFSLGVGNYTEDDIQEAARALTGWRVENGEAIFEYDEFDSGSKTILGQTGPWGAGDVARIALQQPACARYLVKKLFAEFISETAMPSDELLEPLATEFRIRNYDISWLLGKMLTSWVFFSEAAIAQKVKGPVEFIAGMVRGLSGRVGPKNMVEAADKMGQALYYPPSVKGWDGGSDWLNSSTLLLRQNLAFEMTKGTGLGVRSDPAMLASQQKLDGETELAEFFLTLLHQQSDPETVQEMAGYLKQEREQLQAAFHSPRTVNARLARTAAHLALTLPEYQLA